MEMFRKLTSWCFALMTGMAIAGSGVSQTASEFSANIVQDAGGKIVRQKIFVGKGKMRIEPERASPDEAVLIIDFSLGTGYVLMPYQKRYVEANGTQPGSSGLLILLNPRDRRHPCDVLPNANRTAGGKLSCEEVGPTLLNGRSALKWVSALAGGKKGYVWVDRRLGFVTQMEAPGNHVRLEKIEERVQDPELFVVPADYTRLQMASSESPQK
jgi:hypothetical protein